MANSLEPHLKSAFERQAQACAELGSNFTALLCALVARDGLPNGELSDRINAWEGDVSPAGASIPLRLMGALHNLVLTNQAPELVAIYPPNMHPGESKTAERLQNALAGYETEILCFIDRAPQTNETARSATLLPGFLLVAKKFKLPFVHSELGASAGLNLNWDRYGYDYGSWAWGQTDAEPVFTPKRQGTDFIPTPVEVIHRAGCDISPVPIATEKDQLRLKSYVWPDQTDRKERLSKALKVAAHHPTTVEQSDTLQWLQNRLDAAPEGALHVVTHTIAWQYFPQNTKDDGEQAFLKAGAVATATRPLARLRLEADGMSPGAALSLSFWDGSKPEGHHISLGRADFHGRWINWNVGTDLENLNG